MLVQLAFDLVTRVVMKRAQMVEYEKDEGHGENEEEKQEENI